MLAMKIKELWLNRTVRRTFKLCHAKALLPQCLQVHACGSCGSGIIAAMHTMPCHCVHPAALGMAPPRCCTPSLHCFDSQRTMSSCCALRAKHAASYGLLNAKMNESPACGGGWQCQASQNFNDCTHTHCNTASGIAGQHWWDVRHSAITIIEHSVT